jgi:hypothetical protein
VYFWIIDRMLLLRKVRESECSEAQQQPAGMIRSRFFAAEGKLHTHSGGELFICMANQAKYVSIS